MEIKIYKGNDRNICFKIPYILCKVSSKTYLNLKSNKTVELKKLIEINKNSIYI